MPEWRVNRNVDGSGDPSVTIFGLWQSAVNDIWAVGSKGSILRAANCHNGGKPWNRSASGVTSTLRAIWASSSNDLFVVGDGGVILHGDGVNGWRREEIGTTFDLRAVAGSSAANVYAVGDGVILHRVQ